MLALTGEQRHRFEIKQNVRKAAQAAAQLEWLAKRLPAIKGTLDYQTTEAEARRALEDLKATHHALIEAQAEYQAEFGPPGFHFRDALGYCASAIASIMIGLARGDYTGPRKPDFSRVRKEG